MIMNQAMNFMEMFMKELKEADPEQRDHFAKTATTLLQISTEALKTSPEFRNAFALVHAEFLKYPESADTILAGLEAYEKYVH